MVTLSTPSGPTTAGALIRRGLRRQWRSLAGATSLITLWQVCEAAVPVLIGVVINEAVATGDAGRLGIWAAVLCVHFAVLSYAYRFGSRIGFRATQVESHRLRTEVSGHVLAARGARTDRLPGDVLALATSDADMVGSVFRQVALAAAALIGLTVSGIALATIDPVLALVVLVGVPVVLVCTQVLAPRLAHRSAERQESLGRATGLATDLVRGLRPLKGFGGEDTALARYRTQSQDAAVTSVAAARWEGALYGVTQALSGIFLATVALLAGLRAIDGQLTIGELVAVVGLAQFVAEPMGLLAYLVAQVAQSRASAARIVEFLATPPLVEVGARLAGPGHTLAFTGVSTGTLREVSFAAEPGAMVAVMAEQPADAARLMALLCGESSPDQGDVLLAGIPLTQLSLAEARSRMLVAKHHVDLFAGTLRSNLDPDGVLPEERLDQVLEASAAVDIVTTSEHGLDEPVAVDGTTLSGGQRQRVGLARAVAADPHVLVLHDPTTAVDAVTEQRIADALHALRHGHGSARTTLVISSSPALLARADRVVHLRDGYVVAIGSHAELAADEGYRTAVLR